MKQGKLATAGAVALMGALAAAAPALAAPGRVIAVDGIAKDNANRRVEILVLVQSGESDHAAAARALAGQNAKPAPPPPQQNGFSFTGLKWDVLPVVQNYNPAGSPQPGAQQALTATYPTWSNVPRSTYRIQGGGTTPRCPSLVRECPGAQVNDRFNDVGWARLANGILGVTWSTSSIDEADMAINTRYAWTTGCGAQPGAFDLQSVYLHENGHVAGLGHSTDVNAVMYPSYQTARCALGTDDQNGIATLY